MKMIALLTILITVVCILTAGCTGQTNKDAVPEKCVCPVCPSLNVTSTNTTIPDANITVNITKLKGPLRVSIGGYPADLPVFVDNQSVGMVTRAKPLDLLIEEGNRSIKVCVGVICENETVEIVFAKKSFVDFEERLTKDIEFPNPTVRITDYYRSGNGVAVVVEFINPTAKDLTIGAEVNIGYSFINDRTDQRGGESTRGKASALVKAGQRMTTTLNLNFASGYAYMFDPPVLGQITTY